MSDVTSNTTWLVLPGESRTANWRVFDKETALPLDQYLMEFLTNRYRLKLKDFYPEMSAKEVRALLITFKERLGDKK
jgi:hypothetical protein